MKIKLPNFKKALLNKAESFLWYIAKGDEGLRDELNRKGPVNIIKEAIYLSGALSAILTLWVVL